MDAGALLDLLGNENRRRMLQLLSRKPCYVTEISEHLGVSPKAVIDHLRKLEESGLVEYRVDDQRRKYFHISENLRLEVTLAPHDFGMKSAYPASPSLDLSNCQHLSLEMSFEDRRAAANGGQPMEIATLAQELQELKDLERELSLAQRWVQGYMESVIDRLTEAGGQAGSLDADLLSEIARGNSRLADICQEVEAPEPIVENRLSHLADRGLLEERDGKWRLAEP